MPAVPAPDPQHEVRPGGSNALHLAAPPKLRFYVCPHAAISVPSDFPATSQLEPADFVPVVHRETIELLAHTGLRPAGAGLLVVRLFPGKAPKDDTLAVMIREEDGELLECASLSVGEHGQDPLEDGCVDFVLGPVFGDPVDLPTGKPFQGIHLVDVSPGDSSGAPLEIGFAGRSWGIVWLQAHEFHMEFERY